MRTEEMEVAASIDSLSKVMSFIEENMRISCWPDSEINKVLVCAEEIFVNIASYSYVESYSAIGKEGLCQIKVDTDIDARYMIRITFKDQGMPFNPLSMDSPDITLSADDREIGGLGILMVRKMMDDVSYSYEYESNILTMVKYW